jgi:type VI secretion system protein ImpG
VAERGRIDELLTYYERELTFVRRAAGNFKKKYPKIGRRLELEDDQSADPHVERLIESFAFLAARVHLKIDDEFPEITESLLQVLYPHFLRPIPSMSIAQFSLDPELGKLPKGAAIERHRPLFSKKRRDCIFRTCYPLTLWPIEVAGVRVETPGSAANGNPSPAALVLDLRPFQGLQFGELQVDRLRFFLRGESQLTHRLYEMIFRHTTGVELRRSGAEPVRLGLGALREVGFDKDEGMLPYSSRSFLGYRLLQEYFTFPAKFLFFEVTGLDALRSRGFEREASLVLALDRPPRLEEKIGPDNFLLGCTPIVNLFEPPAVAIHLNHAHTEYRVIPDLGRQGSTEVYSVDRVSSLSTATGTTTNYDPFYSFKHSFELRTPKAFWHATRRPSELKDDNGTEVFLTLVDLAFRPVDPPAQVLNVVVTATNRDLPEQLPFDDPKGDFDVERAAVVRTVRCLTKPTRTVRPPLRHGAQWRLISHLSLNFLSAVDGGADRDPEVLRGILSLYDFSDDQAVQDQILGLVGVSSRQVWRRIPTDRGSGFGRGIEATLEFDEQKYVGSGVYLFASVLEKFLALYVSINAFSETILSTKQRGVLKRWPPRSGLQPLL